MEKIVYLLGAGFSQPLRIPVMNNFYLKGRDLYFKDRERYEYFEGVIKNINKLNGVLKYFQSDLYNIEEILSLLEMGISLGSNILEIKKDDFVKFISDVVKYFTPDFKPINRSDLPNDSHIIEQRMFRIRTSDKAEYYVKFVAGLFPIKFSIQLDGRETFMPQTLKFSIQENREAHYSVITLNYDCVIENCIRFLNDSFAGGDELKYLRSSSGDKLKDSKSLYLLKLHGSIDDESIIPPTFNKDLQNEVILNTWKQAYEVLKEADHIRIIGYSLPETDINIRYLLKSSILESHNLQSIDVICLDDNGEVRKKYNEFVKFKYYNFYNENVEKYLALIFSKGLNFSAAQEARMREMNCDVIEQGHKDFFINSETDKFKKL